MGGRTARRTVLAFRPPTTWPGSATPSGGRQGCTQAYPSTPTLLGGTGVGVCLTCYHENIYNGGCCWSTPQLRKPSGFVLDQSNATVFKPGSSRKNISKQFHSLLSRCASKASANSKVSKKSCLSSALSDLLRVQDTPWLLPETKVEPITLRGRTMVAAQHHRTPSSRARLMCIRR